MNTTGADPGATDEVNPTGANDKVVFPSYEMSSRLKKV